MPEVSMELLQKLRKSLYVKSWKETYPEWRIRKVTRVFTNKTGDQVIADGPKPKGWTLEYSVQAVHEKTLKQTTTTVPCEDVHLPVLCDYSETTVDKIAKTKHNKVIVEQTAVGDTCVVLDCPGGETSKALKRFGHDKKKITVTNPGLKWLKDATVYQELLLTFLLGTKKVIDVFYGDYTQEWHGSETGVVPRLDVAVLLERWLLAPDGILAVTVCMRHLKRDKRLTHLDDVQTEIERMGLAEGYSFERVYGAIYHKNFMAFLVLKSVPPAPQVVEVPEKRRRTASAVFMKETHGGLKRKNVS